ncbi:MAG: ABC transporter ATP-binding protein [Eubacteriales bacterium]|nr:ABC transporter ATP-binding protein [Eubacteriales bacterium]
MRILLTYAKKYRRWIAFQLFFATIWVLSQLMIPRLMADIIDKGIMQENMSYIIRLGLVMVAVSLINVASLLANIFFLTRANAGISRDLRSDLFQKVINWSEQVRGRFSTSTLITRNVNDVRQVSNFIDMSLRKIYTLSITIIGAVIIAFTLDSQLALLIFLILPVVLFLASKLTSTALPQYGKIRAAIDKINRLFRQNMSGIRVVKAFGKTEYEEAQFEEAVDEAYEANVKAESTMLLLSPLVMLFANFLILLILWVGGIRAEAGTLEVGVLVAIIEYVILALSNVQSFAAIITIVPRSNVSLKRITDVLTTEETVLLPEDPVLDSLASESETGIVSENLTFSYEDAAFPSVDQVNLRIEAGTTTAIIGSTGSGKSTLLKLLLRNFDADSGSVSVQGHELKTLSRTDFDRLFTLVPQETFLFSGSIRDNIRSGNPEATDEKIWAVLEACEIADFFRQTGEGLDTWIAQNAVNLSGGQKQRISLARGLIRDTSFYLFDDCFSALDFSTERKIRSAIQERLRGKTIIVVAQRVATVEQAEIILVMEDGRIVDRGTHPELLESSAVYQEIVRSQVREEVA